MVHIRDGRGIPVTDILVESRSTGEHGGHIENGRSIPISDVLVKSRGRFEHRYHVRHRGSIPPAYVLIEVGAVLEGFGHVRHRRNVPVPDVPVGRVRICLVGEPQVDGGLEIGVVDYDVLPPIVRPMWVG